MNLRNALFSFALSVLLSGFNIPVFAESKGKQLKSTYDISDSSGIRFQEGNSWNDVLALAKSENKLVFVDIYTSWCVPCKKMSEEVFVNKKVGEKYNANFINYKIDAEKGEGFEIARNYNIRAYPTYLFVDGNGTLFYTVTSYMPPTQFIQQAIMALNERNDPKPYPL